jgi:hypothetical protein
MPGLRHVYPISNCKNTRWLSKPSVSGYGFVFKALILPTDDFRAVAFGIESYKNIAKA